MTKFHLFSQDSVRLETAPTGAVRKSYPRNRTEYHNPVIFISEVH